MQVGQEEIGVIRGERAFEDSTQLRVNEVGRSVFLHSQSH